MNEEQMRELREQMEVRIVALLLGEASAFETAELEQTIGKNPELAAFHAHMRRTIELTREVSKQFQAASQPTAAQPKLSVERREVLLARFNEAKIVKATVARPERPHRHWLIPASLAAGFVAFALAISMTQYRRVNKLMDTVGDVPDIDRLAASGKLEKHNIELEGSGEHLASRVPPLAGWSPPQSAPQPAEPAVVQGGPAPKVYLPLGQSALESTKADGERELRAGRFGVEAIVDDAIEPAQRELGEAKGVNEMARNSLEQLTRKPGLAPSQQNGQKLIEESELKIAKNPVPSRSLRQDGDEDRALPESKKMAGGAGGIAGFGGGAGFGISGSQPQNQSTFRTDSPVLPSITAPVAPLAIPGQPAAGSFDTDLALNDVSGLTYLNGVENGRRSEIRQKSANYSDHGNADAFGTSGANKPKDGTATVLEQQKSISSSFSSSQQKAKPTDLELGRATKDAGIISDPQSGESRNAANSSRFFRLKLPEASVPAVAAPGLYHQEMLSREDKSKEWMLDVPNAWRGDAGKRDLLPQPNSYARTNIQTGGVYSVNIVGYVTNVVVAKLDMAQLGDKREIDEKRKSIKIQNAGHETNISFETPKPATSAPTPQPEINTRENAFSTFSLNVSDVSFKLAAASLENNAMPDPASIRVEEFVNAFNYHDPAPGSGARLAFAWERAHYPFTHNRDIVRLAIQTAARGREPQKPLNLVILLDNSGSMERADRAQIVREALKVLAQQLRAQDRISIIAFARTARLWVDGMEGGKAKELLDKVLELNPDGGTNLEEALGLGYTTATRHFQANGINRVILLTDGAANLGNVEPEALKQQVIAHRIKGIALDCFGIGWEGYNDDLLEVLSHNGDGRYGFLNRPEEAAPEFANQLAGALNVEAADVKTQVEFNPLRVSNWRQIGYAKHQLTKEQFRDNTVDAAELAAAESGNALYAIEVNPEGDGPLGVVRVRYKIPATGKYVEQAWTMPYQSKVSGLDEASPAMRLAVTASAFGEWLSRSPYAGEVTPAALQPYLNSVCETYAPDPRPQRLAWMIRQAQSIGGK